MESRPVRVTSGRLGTTIGRVEPGSGGMALGDGGRIRWTGGWHRAGNAWETDTATILAGGSTVITFITDASRQFGKAIRYSDVIYELSELRSSQSG